MIRLRPQPTHALSLLGHLIRFHEFFQWFLEWKKRSTKEGFWPSRSFSIICACTTYLKFTNPFFNHFSRWRKFLITFIKSLFRRHGVFSHQATVFNQLRKFTFFHFNKKIKTCSLLSSVTFKVNNEIGSNCDGYCLRDCTSWEKCENVICGSISVSSHGLTELPSTTCEERLWAQTVYYFIYR